MRKNRITANQRHVVAERAKGCCEYCLSQLHFSMQSFSIEHIIPVDKGGKTELENLALSCQGCNNHKYNKIEGYDPVSRQFVPLFHPR
jgi:5-methylcytosine-specific restriction endonuclease McrA